MEATSLPQLGHLDSLEGTAWMDALGGGLPRCPRFIFSFVWEFCMGALLVKGKPQDGHERSVSPTLAPQFGQIFALNVPIPKNKAPS
jgi:hypothetical protein